jgi:hypothetical protein
MSTQSIFTWIPMATTRLLPSKSKTLVALFAAIRCERPDLAEIGRGLAGLSEAAYNLIAYLERRVHRMEYPEYLARGWSIGSCTVESACKTMVGQDLKMAGMRWGRGRLPLCLPSPRPLLERKRTVGRLMQAGLRRLLIACTTNYCDAHRTGQFLPGGGWPTARTLYQQTRPMCHKQCQAREIAFCATTVMIIRRGARRTSSA